MRSFIRSLAIRPLLAISLFAFIIGTCSSERISTKKFIASIKGDWFGAFSQYQAFLFPFQKYYEFPVCLPPSIDPPVCS